MFAALRPAAARASAVSAPATRTQIATLRTCAALAESKGTDEVRATGTLKTAAEMERQGEGKALLPWARYNVSETNITYHNANKFALTSAVTPETVGRTAIVYKPSRPSWTSGQQQTKVWKIRFDHRPKWSSPLMGYLSSSDTLRQLKQALTFDSPEQAIMFARRNGWTYTVEDPEAVGREVKSYGFNFLAENTEKYIKLVGPKKAAKLYNNSNWLKNPWINLKFTKRGEEDWGKKEGGGDMWTPESLEAHLSANAPKAAAEEPKKAAKKAAPKKKAATKKKAAGGKKKAAKKE